MCAPCPQVENLFAVGLPCERWYGELMEAYRRLCDRLGVVGEDDDVEVIITAQRRIEREVAYHMFRYGAQLERGKNKNE